MAGAQEKDGEFAAAVELWKQVRREEERTSGMDTLDEIINDITGETPASFEPTIDYIVTKVPRFAFEKLPGAEPTLTTSMKSVGEVMAIGRTFQESLQKALRSLETGLT